MLLFNPLISPHGAETRPKLEEASEKQAIEEDKAELDEDAKENYLKEQDSTSKLIEATFEATGELSDLLNALTEQKSDMTNLQKILETQTQLLEKMTKLSMEKEPKQSMSGKTTKDRHNSI